MEMTPKNFLFFRFYGTYWYVALQIEALKTFNIGISLIG